jgi:hypothetical protein
MEGRKNRCLEPVKNVKCAALKGNTNGKKQRIDEKFDGGKHALEEPSSMEARIPA